MANKSLFWTLTILLTVISVYILTTTVILPVATINPLPAPALPKTEARSANSGKKSDKADNTPRKGADKNVKKADSNASANYVTDASVSNSSEELAVFYELKKTESVLRSRYNLSSADSIYLVLDLVNKMARLEMKGIPLHNCVISDVWISNSIKKFHSEALLRWIAQPFVLKNAESTIERVQFVVKIAPKDTIEASKVESSPALRKVDDVYIVMNFDRNLQVVIQQSEKSEGADKARIDSLKNTIFRKETGKSMDALKTFKREAVMPKIVLTLPKTDVITLYRGLPQKPRMILRM